MKNKLSDQITITNELGEKIIDDKKADEKSLMNKNLLELLSNDEKEQNRIEGVVIGELTSVSELGQVKVDFPGNPVRRVIPARSTTVFSADEIGTKVALMFEAGDPLKPIVLGPLQKLDKSQHNIMENVAVEQPIQVDAYVDGEKITLNAKNEIVLQCGESSITLTKAGKILIRGKYILSRSTGVNRIKGGSVLLN